ncbi:MAG TPA: cellulase family glycosylhydrolase [Candidatus Dormibacteraeota bacterium]|nr:cellulase family glycosylhydrolase [Candidatus Dormibacteraeota bacterium]
MRVALPCVVALMCLAVAGNAAVSIPGLRAANGTVGGLRVSGNQVVDAGTGQLVKLRGVNRSGSEYACIQGWGIFDGPSDAASVAAIKSWGVNVVRVPLNEDCWLGINQGSLPSVDYGQSYISAIKTYTDLLNQNGIYAEVALIWGAPGSNQATYQPGGPDADHSPAMWTSMAQTFAGDQGVILAPWGETITDWTCFMQVACSNEATYGPKNTGYLTATMQQAVTLMRAAGYHGIISIPCIDYANDCNGSGSSWLASHPLDADNQLIAEAHVYGNNTCGAQSNGACLPTQYGTLARSFPVIWGETGETYDDSECTANNMKVLLPWADQNISGYIAWTWDTWGNCDALIADYTGTVNTTTPGGAQYGQYVHDHLISLAASLPTPAPAPNPAPSPSPSPSSSPPAAPTPAPSPSPSSTPSPPSPTPAASPSPSQSPSPSPSATPSSAPSPSPTPSTSPTPVVPPSPTTVKFAGRTATSFEQGGGSAVRIKVPGTYHTGDLLVVAEAANQDNTAWTAPSGWTAGGGGQLDGQDLWWWWKVASRNEPNSYSFTHSRWADGGMVMLDFTGTSATPILGASAIGAFDNDGVGNVSQASCGAVTGATGASLLLIGWQSSAAYPAWPARFATMATSNDGFSYVAAAGNLNAVPSAPQSVQMNPAQDAVLTAQIAIH